MSRKEEEYLRRQLELGYEPSLAGMDEEDFDYVPSWVQNRTPSPPLAREYRPVDRAFAERIFRMFRRPVDRGWQMPDLAGPEYRQPQPESDPERTGMIQTLPNIMGQKEPGTDIPSLYSHIKEPVGPLQYLAAGAGVQPASGSTEQKSAGKWSDTKMQIDPFGWFPQYDTGQGSSGSSAGNGTLDGYRNNEAVPGIGQSPEPGIDANNRTSIGLVKLWKDENPDWDNLHPKMKDSTTTFVGEINKQFGAKKTPWVTSGYRSPERNANIPGASPNSWHRQGMAVDMNLDDYTPDETAKIEDMARERFHEVLWHNAGTGLHLHVGNPKDVKR